jgi:hypothetical protein
MGEGANGMKPGDGEPGASGRISKEIEHIRGEIGSLVDELDRRRRELFDVRLQMRRHPVAFSVVGFSLAAILGGSIALLVYNGKRKQRASYKAKQLKVAFGRMMEHPERVGRGEPPPAEKILAAVGTAAATLLVKRALARAVPPPPEKAKERDAKERQRDGQQQQREAARH